MELSTVGKWVASGLALWRAEVITIDTYQSQDKVKMSVERRQRVEI
jgi:hypothetical protein